MKRNIVFAFFLFTLFLCVAWEADAQVGRGILRMELLDTLRKEPVQYATISMYREGSDVPVRYGVSGSEGHVEISDLEHGKYLIEIAHVSYQTVLKYIEIGKKALNLGKVWMTERSLDMDEAVVVGERPVVQKGDTTEYNAKFFNNSPTDYLGDLLEKMPGLEVIGSRIYFHGKPVSSLTVEGRQFFSGDNSVALENLPAYVVDKVSVFKDKRFETSGIEDITNASLVLNVTLKEGMKNGLIANLNPRYGTENRYSTKNLLGVFGEKATKALVVSANNISQNAGSGSTFNVTEAGYMMPEMPGHMEYDGDIEAVVAGLDYSTKETSMNGTYRHNKQFNETVTRRETKQRDGLSLYNEDNEVRARSNSGKALLYLYKGFERENGHRVSVRFVPSINYSKTFTDDENRFSHQGVGENPFVSQGESRNSGMAEALNANCQFGLSFTKFSLNFSGNYMRNSNDYRNISTTDYGGSLRESIDQRRKNVYENFHFRTGFSFRLPWDMHLSYHINFKNNTSDMQTFALDSTGTSYLPVEESLSSCVKRISVEQGLELRKYLSRKWRFSLQLLPLWERTERNGERDHYRRWNVIPLISYNTLDLSFSYKGSVSHPSIEQLNPIRNDDNPLYVYVGNPGLRPSYHHALLFYHRIKGFTYNVGGSLIQRKIISRQTIDERGVTQTMPVNEDGDFSFYVNGRLQWGMGRNVSCHPSASFRYIRGIGYFDESKYHSDNYTLDAAVSWRYKRPYFEASWGGSVQYSNTDFSIYGLNKEATKIYRINAGFNWALPYEVSLIASYDQNLYDGFESDDAPVALLNVEVCKPFYKNRIIFSVKGYDLLNQRKNLKVSYADNYVEEVRVNMVRRFVLFSLSYRFNKF